MKLADILIISLAFVFIIIGMYEMMAIGPREGYWSVMLAVALFFWYQIRKRKD
jgi:hypothetical protein